MIVSLSNLKARFAAKDKPTPRDFTDLIDTLGGDTSLIEVTDLADSPAPNQWLRSDGANHPFWGSGPSIPGSLPPSGAAGGQLKGNYPNPDLREGGGALATLRTKAGNDGVDYQRSHLHLLTQNGHGFQVADAVYPSGSNTFAKAVATSPATAQILFVFEVIDANTCILCNYGKLPISTANHQDGNPFLPNTVYFLSATQAGKYTTQEPNVSVRCLLATSSSVGFFFYNRPVVANAAAEVPRNLAIRIVETIGGTLTVSANQISIKADAALLRSAGGDDFSHTTVNVTIDKTSTGANGRESAFTITAATLYYLWLISDGNTLAGLVSVSNSNPVLPNGYKYKLLVGAAATDNSTTDWLYVHEYGERIRLVSCAITPPANWSTLNAGMLIKQFAHRFGRVPTAMTWRVVRKAATNGADGYAIGAEIDIADTDSSSTGNQTCGGFMDANNVGLLLSTGTSNNMRVINPSTYGRVVVSDDDYNIRCILEA